MDKYKLVRIIAKDLEELKTLSDEIEANVEASSLIMDLALSRARLLCQELELLQSYTAPVCSLKEESGIENSEDDENEESDQSFSEPELEILHFEESDYKNSDELEDEEEEMVVYDSEDEEPEEETENDFEEDEEPQEDDLTEDDDSDEELQEVEVEDDKLEEDDFAAIEEHELNTDEDEEVSKIEEDEEEPLKPVQQSVRQIEITELDEEDDDVEFSPVSSPVNRPVMHEIPKPEAPLAEEEEVEEDNDDQETPTSETFQKERSLNKTLGENKAAETTISNSPISSLRAAIGLNDRFLFIKDIFNNNSEKYNTIIDQLDKMETIQQAVDYLKVNLSLQKNETSMKFVDLLKRRFTK